GQAVDAARGRHEPDPRLGEPEAGVLGSDDDVAGECQLEPASEGEAVHRGDERLPDVVARDQSPEASLRHAPHAVLRGPLEVVAGREGAFTRTGQTATQTSGSATTSSHARASSSWAGGWSAFRTSGRLNVTQAM